MNEPVADAVRGILDGHIVLSRALAHANHYPAVDVLESISRLNRDVCSAEELELVARAREHLAVYRKNEDLVTIGAYQKGTNAQLDRAVALYEPLKNFLRQSVQDHVPRVDCFSHLKKILS
jgi:flagellum-specific ATP synthase